MDTSMQQRLGDMATRLANGETPDGEALIALLEDAREALEAAEDGAADAEQEIAAMRLLLPPSGDVLNCLNACHHAASQAYHGAVGHPVADNAVIVANLMSLERQAWAVWALWAGVERHHRSTTGSAPRSDQGGA